MGPGTVNLRRIGPRLTGTGLRLLAPRVQTQEFPLPSWLADQAVITTLLGEAVEPQPADESTKVEEDASAAAKGLKQARFAPTVEIKALSNRWTELAAQQSDLQASAYLLICLLYTSDAATKRIV